MFDIRFGIRRPDGFVSDVWRATTPAPGEFHLVTDSLAGTEKYTFGPSGLCRSAFIRPPGTPVLIRDRESFNWRRTATPPRSSGSAARIAWIAFPTDYLSRPAQAPDGETLWIDAAPTGGATFVEVAFATESEDRIRGVLDIVQDRTLVGTAPLPGGELLVIFCYHGDWDNKDLRVAGVTAEILFSSDDPEDSGRPLRRRFGPVPRDGEAVMLLELGGAPISSSREPT